MLSDRPTKKRAVNLFVDVELLDEARRLRINISETLEHRLRTIVRAEQERRWLDANKVAIEAYNLRVARDGLLADEAGLLLSPMKQFDIVANPFPRSRERQPYLVALQSDLVRSLDTVVVAPLEPAASGTFADRLNPRVDVDGEPFVLVAQELVTVRKSVLGAPRGSIAGARDAVIAALDLLFTGF